MPMETSHVWVGMFESEEQLDAYFEEQYEDDDAPINRFAADQGEMYYDHDWVERAFCQSGDLHKLIDGASYSCDYMQDVIVAATKLGIQSANTFILADSEEFDDPKAVDTAERRLWYIGKFKCHV
jgi:hypothetical protein